MHISFLIAFEVSPFVTTKFMSNRRLGNNNKKQNFKESFGLNIKRSVLWILTVITIYFVISNEKKMILGKNLSLEQIDFDTVDTS